MEIIPVTVPLKTMISMGIFGGNKIVTYFNFVSN
jgi:hypothetical protein